MSRAVPVPAAARAQLGIALSPYHLATGELPALASAVLADRVVTMLPLPPGHEHEARERAETSPAYAGFMEAWSWSAPLWEAGALGARLDADDAGRDLIDVLDELEGRDELAELRPFVGGRAGGLDPGVWLEGVARDLVRGGPDPGWCVPLAAAIDRFAARRGLAAARAAPVSLAQKAEARLNRPVFAFVIPMLVQADGGRLVEVRETLAAPLGALRARMSEAFAAALGQGDADEADPGALRLAADTLAGAFEDARDTLTRPPEDEDDPRVLAGLVSVSGVLLPSDAAFRSSLSALRRARGRAPRRAAPLPGDMVASLVFRRVGR